MIHNWEFDAPAAVWRCTPPPWPGSDFRCPGCSLVIADELVNEALAAAAPNERGGIVVNLNDLAETLSTPKET